MRRATASNLEIGGVRIYWESLGRGEPVVFLNGVLMTTQSWGLQTSVLGRSYRCLLHDFRGQLLSGKPSRPWSLEDHALDLRALLDHWGLKSCHCEPEFFRAFARLIDAFRQLQITDRLDRIRCPTLVLVGDRDVLNPARYSRIIADRIPGSKLILVPDAGHAVNLERPEVVNRALLEFLARAAAGGESPMADRE